MMLQEKKHTLSWNSWRNSSSAGSKWFQRRGGETKTISTTFLTFNHFESFNLFTRWVDPQFDDENQEEEEEPTEVVVEQA